ncbi:UNVERIFIED_ORG: hypothetical protein M2402_002550 [Rahnella aquatilis]
MMGVTRLLAPMARLLGLNRVAMVASNAVTQLFSAGLRGLRVTLLAASMAARIGSASFLLMIAPVAAIALAIAAVVIAVIKFWQPIKAFVSGFISGFGQAAGALTPFSGLFSGIGKAIGWVWDGVKTLVGWFGDLLTPIQMTQGQLTNVTSAGETFGRLVAAAINIILIPLELVFRAIGGMVDMFKIVRDGWIDVVKSFDINSPVESFEKIASVIGNVFGKLWDSLKASFTGTYNWIVEKLNNIPGVNIELKEVPVTVTPKGMPPANTMPNSVANASAAMPPGFNGVTNQISGAGNKNPVLQPPQPIGNDILTGGTVKGVERGGLKKEINTNTETTIDNSKKIGTVNIHPSKGLTPAELMEWQELN